MKSVKINAVRYYRQQSGLTQVQLSKLVGVSGPAISHIEAGGGFDAETAHKLAKAFEQQGLDYNRILAELSNPETRTLTLVPEARAETAEV